MSYFSGPLQDDTWLIQALDIRHSLESLAHPDSQVFLSRPGQDTGLQARILGLDARSMIFFWRLADIHADLQADEAEMNELSDQSLDFRGLDREKKTQMLFCAGPSRLIRFSDDSLLMIASFPQSLQQIKLC